MRGGGGLQGFVGITNIIVKPTEELVRWQVSASVRYVIYESALRLNNSKQEEEFSKNGITEFCVVFYYSHFGAI